MNADNSTEKTVNYQRPPVKVALFGLGRAMFNEHYPIYKAHPGLFQIVAACDIEKDRRDIIAKDFPNCRMFRRCSEMFEERDIDLVDIATTSANHVEHAIASLKHDRWTLLETPMALTFDDANRLRGAAMKAKNRLIMMQRGLYSPDYLLARQVMTDSRLGQIYDLKIRSEDFVRRDDWQCVKRLGGGAAYYAMTDLILQALRLLPSPPVQMWGELKRLASLGDAEDFAHLNLKTRDTVSAEVEFSGGALAPNRGPSFEIRGERGVFRVQPGASEGVLTVIDPAFEFPRRRSSVRVPPMVDLHEEIPVVTIPVALKKGTLFGPSAFWRQVYASVRTGAAFPIKIEESMEAVKFAHLMKKTSPFGK